MHLLTTIFLNSTRHSAAFTSLLDRWQLLWLIGVLVGQQILKFPLINTFLAVAIWLILTICFERLIGIRYPLSSRKGKFCDTKFLITGIVLSTGLLTAYHYFSQDCKVKIFCHGTQVHRLCYSIDEPTRYLFLELNAGGRN